MHSNRSSDDQMTALPISKFDGTLTISHRLSTFTYPWKNTVLQTEFPGPAFQNYFHSLLTVDKDHSMHVERDFRVLFFCLLALFLG